MKKILSFVAILFYTFIWSQIDIKKSSISTAGGSHTQGNITLISAVGEVAVQENTQGNTHISEGFIGPDIISAVGIENYAELQGIQVFPNPVISDLHIHFVQNAKYEIYIYDLNGKQLLFIPEYIDTECLIDLSAYRTGVYMLIIVDRKAKQHKIIKLSKA